MTAFVVIFMDYLVAYFLFGLFYALGNLFVGKFSKMELYRFEGLGVRFENENGKRKITTCKTVFPSCQMYTEEKKSNKQDVLYGVVSLGIAIGISVVVSLATAYVGKENLYAKIFSVAMFVCCVLGTISSIITIFRMHGKSENARCFRGVREITEQIKQGIRPRDIKLSSDEEIVLGQKVTYISRTYVLLRYYMALDQKDWGQYCKHATNLENSLSVISKTPMTGGIYNELVFFYSFVQKDERKAEYYRRESSEPIEKDKDVNGRRIYAYYLYYVKGDVEQALSVIHEGEQVADNFIMKGNIPMEKELLAQLKQEIHRRKGETI